ncbi:MAG: hypothetical protein WC787_03415 [Patescibacteria group bacterium]|jgi:hypothetical protein
MDRRNLVYWIILGVLITALAVVGVLILRKRAAPPVVIPIGGAQNGTEKTPPKSKPLEDYVPARPYQDGDVPSETVPESEFGGEPTTP